ncbi:MAG: sensor histidine kinase, partial [Kofleriaceae bacterium]
MSGRDLMRIFPGTSELAHLMREIDWAQTDLGSPAGWPENLKTAVSICLTSRFPIVLWWGPQQTLLYNDACIPFLGETKHPRYLGRPGRECWSEIWSTIGPILDSVRLSGQATWSGDVQYFFARRLPREEVYARFSYGPLLAADGVTVDGIFSPCTETTEQVVGARRLETLRRLGERVEARTVLAACAEAARVLGDNPHDIPFAAIYVVDEAATMLRMAAATGLASDHPLPAHVQIADGDPDPWPLITVLRNRRSFEVDTHHIPLPGGPWPEPTTRSVVLPIRESDQKTVAALLVVGVSPRRVWNPSYQTFFDLVAGHIGTTLAVANAYESERRRAEALAEIDRVKTTFFSNISHEFRTPLTMMLGPMEDALAAPHGVLQGEELEIVHHNARRLLRLVNALLDFSRIESGRIQASYQPTDIAAITTDLASGFRAAIEKVGIELVVECPPLSQPVYVDRDMWEKIVLNLVSNAFKFTFEGRIAVSLRETAEGAMLSVSDTGIGIAAEHVPHVFERFHRIEGARARTHEGSGIGLALVQELVRLHDGTLTVDSVLGVGTTFTVTVPFGVAVP